MTGNEFLFALGPVLSDLVTFLFAALDIFQRFLHVCLELLKLLALSLFHLRLGFFFGCHLNEEDWCCVAG
jgi:hypothetical protein